MINHKIKFYLTKLNKPNSKMENIFYIYSSTLFIFEMFSPNFLITKSLIPTGDKLYEEDSIEIPHNAYFPPPFIYVEGFFFPILRFHDP